MRAKFIYESIKDSLRSKSEEEINLEFKKFYKMSFYEWEAYIKKLNNLVVEEKIIKLKIPNVWTLTELLDSICSYPDQYLKKSENIMEAADILIKVGASPKYIEKENNHWPIILGAVSNNNIELIKFLIKHGADPRHWNDYALTETMGETNIETVKFLIKCGLNPKAKNDKPIKRACVEKNWEVVKELIKYY
jgi:ankyrin repeat protein